jgi:GAF domain-containing protein
MNIRELTEYLEHVRVALGAASCTLYVPDPYWIDEFRLVCMPGVKMQEPMHGFLSPDQSRRNIYDGRHILFCPPDRLVDPTRHQIPIPATIPEDKRFLFGDFWEREGVQSCARVGGVDGSPENTKVPPKAVLFVNFTTVVDFDEELRAKIKGIYAEVLKSIPDVTRELKKLDQGPIAEVLRVLQPALELAKSPAGTQSRNAHLSEHFTEILRLSLGALGIDKDDGLGAIYLFDYATGHLNLAASYGDAPELDKARTLSAFSGEGVISWVVVRRRAILINGLGKSKFGGIHRSVNRDVQNQLAVPMIANGELIGVLNLECKRKLFSPASVRSLWYAANRAAVAHQISKTTGTTNTMLQICAGASRNQEGASDSLKEIARALKEGINADFCDIWHYNEHLQAFDAAGASYDPFQPTGIRPDGWSMYVREHGNPVWISSIVDSEKFRVGTWVDGQWRDVPNGMDQPATVNDRLLESRVEAELGTPIKVAGNCVGVAWMKYKRSRLPPSGEVMAEIISLANQAGFVLESVSHQREAPEREALRRIGEHLRNRLSLSGPLQFGKLSMLEGFVIHRSVHPDVCGDFHAIRIVNDSTVGILIGDGEGHGVTGLLNALPLITTFEAFSGHSGSTLYLMEKLMSISDELGVRGTALYCTFTVIEGSLWLSGTSAGHPHAILLRRTSFLEDRPFPPPDNPSCGRGLGHRIKIPLPFSQSEEKLHAGDILLTYTDGVSDSFCEGRSEAARKLANIAFQNGSGSCQEIANAIMAAVEKEGQLGDDAMVCVVRVKA